MSAACGAESLWPGITCQLPPHGDDRKHDAEDGRGSYVWSTAAVEADREGRCPGCLRFICACPCSCPECTSRKNGNPNR